MKLLRRLLSSTPLDPVRIPALAPSVANPELEVRQILARNLCAVAGVKVRRLIEEQPDTFVRPSMYESAAQ